MAFISIRGAQEHNLKNIDVDIPKNALVAFTGVSGSGKSSLVFDTLYAEAFRRFSDSSQTPVYLLGNSSWSKLKRPKCKSIYGLPPALGLSQRQSVASKYSTVGTLSGLSDLFRVYYAAFGNIFCKKCDIPLNKISFLELSNKILSEFQTKKIMIIAPIVEKRKGAFADEIEKFRQLGFSKLRLNNILYDLQDETEKIKIDAKKLNTIDVIIDFCHVNDDKKLRIERALQQALEYGKGIIKIQFQDSEYKYNTKSNCPQCGESAPKLDPRYFSHSSLGKCNDCLGSGSLNEDLPLDLFPCTSCSGTRLTKDMPIVRVCGKTISELQQMKMSELNKFILNDLIKYTADDKSRKKVFLEIKNITESIVNLGLSHLNLNRSGNSLAPGDLQRIRLATMISNKLTGVFYAIDEPCQGMTSEEVKQLASVLRDIVVDGASIIAVEHHPVFLSFCDHLFLMGPNAGVNGGQIVSITTGLEGLGAFHETQQNKQIRPKIEFLEIIQDLKQIKSKKNSKTQAISGDGKTSNNSLVLTSSLEFSDIKLRNLKIDKVTLNQSEINIIRGKSGSAKSSFINLCLHPFLKKQGAIEEESEDSYKIPFDKYCKVKMLGDVSIKTLGYVRPGAVIRSSRKSVASALDILKPLREIFSKLTSSQVMGLSENHFSWNSKLGRCENCEGRGYLELAQKYSPAIRIECEQCLGVKLNSRSLVPRFKGYNFADIMNLTLDQALEIFENQKIIYNRIIRACHFGLGYVQLGQGMDSLSGGEIQRLNLTIELKRAALGGSWFLLTHPSTGLHQPDIEILGELMQMMCKKGATFVLIENREEFYKFSNNIINFSD